MRKAIAILQVLFFRLIIEVKVMPWKLCVYWWNTASIAWILMRYTIVFLCLDKTQKSYSLKPVSKELLKTGLSCLKKITLRALPNRGWVGDGAG